MRSQQNLTVKNLAGRAFRLRSFAWKFLLVFALLAIANPLAAAWQYVCIDAGTWRVYEAENQDENPRLIADCHLSFCGAYENGQLRYTYWVSGCVWYI